MPKNKEQRLKFNFSSLKFEEMDDYIDPSAKSKVEPKKTFTLKDYHEQYDFKEGDIVLFKELNNYQYGWKLLRLDVTAVTDNVIGLVCPYTKEEFWYDMTTIARIADVLNYEKE